jgi:hypothetical protein
MHQHNRYPNSCLIYEDNITITILEIILCPVFYLKHAAAETDFYFRLQMVPTEFGLTEYIQLFSSYIYRAQLSTFHLKTNTNSSLRNVVF